MLTPESVISSLPYLGLILRPSIIKGSVDLNLHSCTPCKCGNKIKSHSKTSRQVIIRISLFWLYVHQIYSFLFFQFYKVYNYQFIVEPDGTGTDIGVQQVNCFDWEDVCAKENIKLYPTLRFYRLVLSLLYAYKSYRTMELY